MKSGLSNGRMRADITRAVGGTPLVMLRRMADGLPGRVAVKMEACNPLGSVKDRIAVAMVNAAERDGLIGPDGVLIEATSGNTGIGLAFVAASRGYRLILTMPDTMSIERRRLLEILGAEIILTPGEKGMAGALSEAERILKSTPSGYMLQQFRNPANPEIHRRTTAEEIWQATGGAIDVFVGGWHRRDDNRGG